MDRVILIGIAGILILVITIYFIQYEGFVSGRAPLASSTNSSLPAPLQESMIAHDIPGAVTAAPDQSSASTQDLIALQDALRFFEDSLSARDTLYGNSIGGSAETVGGLAQLKRDHSKYETRVTSALTDLSKNDFTVEEATRLRTFYEMGADQLLTLTEGFANPPSKYTIAGPFLNTNDLQELINRINTTRMKLVNQRSTASTVRARIDQLEKLGADVKALREKVIRKQMNPRDLPIDAEAARKFLAGLSASDIPPLITPGGGSPSTASSPAASVFDNPAVQTMLDQAKNLRWSMQVTVGYDPEVFQRDNLLKRLDKIEKRLMELSTKKGSEKEYESLSKELQILSAALGGVSFSGAPTASVRPQIPTSTRLPTLWNQPNGPTQDNLSCAQSNLFSDPSASLPSFSDYAPAGMTDEQIKHRASSGTAVYDGVGGADYKTRTLDLCRSITASGLGDSKDFGCIANPDTVGPTYSWKGAHKMVCNRLGDTWGASYPEQFGCGKYDPTARFNSAVV